MESAKRKCNRAIAYLKANIKDDDRSQPLALKPGDSPVLQAFCGNLLIAYVIEHDASFEFLNERTLEAAGLSNSDMRRIGIRNLADRLRGKLEVTKSGEVAYFTKGDGFEASAILLDRLWNVSLTAFAPTGFIAALPARDVLAVCDRSSVAGVAALYGIIRRVFSRGDHLLIPTLIERRMNMWMPYRSGR